MQIVAVDIGGTHARFALAEVMDGGVLTLGDATTLNTADHDSFVSAWQHFLALSGVTAPEAVALAVAAPVGAAVIPFTNNRWTIAPARITDQLGVRACLVVNDFAAVGHAVAQAGNEHFLHLAGPEIALPDSGTISIIGPGTGLGVAHVLREPGRYHVQPTEGGHIGFAPVDGFEDALLARLRGRYARVSVERVVSGPGLADIHAVLAEDEGCVTERHDDKLLWQLGTSGTDRLVTAAVERFCLLLGSVAGDIALAQGASGVVIAGGLGLRIKDVLMRSGFARRFCAKGRFEALMAGLPVKLITHPQPGLFGVAAAFAREHR